MLARDLYAATKEQPLPDKDPHQPVPKEFPNKETDPVKLPDPVPSPTPEPGKPIIPIPLPGEQVDPQPVDPGDPTIPRWRG